MGRKRSRIFVLNEPNAPRLNPALADEIGLNESIILLQIEFWISISNNREDGRDWTYQSVRDMKDKMFTFWSISTINRAINSLIDSGFLIEGNYNKKKYDRTRWFALNYEKLAELESISVPGHELKPLHYETGSNHNDTGANQIETGRNQNGTGVNQIDTTIPEITTETTTEKSAESNSDDDFRELVVAFEQNGFGTISSMVSNRLIQLSEEYTSSWVLDAIKIAVERNARNLRYVEGILMSWQANGKDDGISKEVNNNEASWSEFAT